MLKPGPPAALRLEAVSGPHAGEAFLLDESTLYAGADIGRSPTLPIRLDRDPFVSRRHASIRLDDGMILLTDERGNRNGTLVNDARLPRGASTPIQDGDTILLGDSVLRARWIEVESDEGL